MTDHLSPAILNGLTDGELSAEQMAIANEHLAGCPVCTSNALHQTLLKAATARAGRRYAPPPQLRERLMRLAAREESGSEASGLPIMRSASSRSSLQSMGQWRYGWMGWATAAVLLLVSASTILIQHATRRAQIASEKHAALVTEVFDQHVATLAGNLPPQVISTDRHTVKPWFQGKLPFSFNLPEGLPTNTTLDGANLTYLDDQPVAQLLYSIGRHRVSVFVQEKPGAGGANELTADHSGFHVVAFSTHDLELVAVSDADPTRLAELVKAIKQAQS